MLGLLALGHAASAAAEPTRSIALYLEGPAPERVGAALQAALQGRARLLDPAAFLGALRREGAKLPLGMNLYVPKKRKPLVSLLRNAGTASAADGVIVARATGKGAKLVVAVAWIDPRAPEPLLSAPLRLVGDAATDRAATAALLAAPLQTLGAAPPLVAAVPAVGTSPGAGAAPAGAGASLPSVPGVNPSGGAAQSEPPGAVDGPRAPVAAGGAEAPSVPRGPRDSALLIADLGFELGGRSFSYSDPLTANLPDYSVFGAPLLALRVELYPGARTRRAVLRDLGLYGQVSHAFGLSSATASGAPLGTDWTRAGGGLRYRLALPQARGLLLGAALGVDWLNFTIDAEGALARLVASASYLAVRVGVDARLPLWRVAVLLDGAYDAPLHGGPVYERQREPFIGGVELGAGVALPLPLGFEVNLRGRYTRCFSSFHPVPGDEYVAGGALDQLYTFGGGASYAF